jgi:hypothetical protein
MSHLLVYHLQLIHLLCSTHALSWRDNLPDAAAAPPRAQDSHRGASASCGSCELLRHLARGVFAYDAHTLREHHPGRVHCKDGTPPPSRIPIIHSRLYKVPPQSRPVPGHFGSGAAPTVFRENAELARRALQKALRCTADYAPDGKSQLRTFHRDADEITISPLLSERPAFENLAELSVARSCSNISEFEVRPDKALRCVINSPLGSSFSRFRGSSLSHTRSELCLGAVCRSCGILSLNLTCFVQWNGRQWAGFSDP